MPVPERPKLQAVPEQATESGDACVYASAPSGLLSGLALCQAFTIVALVAGVCSAVVAPPAPQQSAAARAASPKDAPLRSLFPPEPQPPAPVCCCTALGHSFKYYCAHIIALSGGAQAQGGDYW